MLIYCNRNISWRLTDSIHFSEEEIPMETWLPCQQLRSTEMDVPHVGRTPGSWSHASPRGCGTRWGLSSSQDLVAHPGAPQSESCLLFRFLLPWKPRLATCSVLPGPILLLKGRISKVCLQEVFDYFLASRTIKTLPLHHLLRGKCHFRNSSGKKTSSS